MESYSGTKMLQIKRLLLDNDYPEGETKKLKKILHDKKIMTCFENLPNEIFYEISEYLDGCDLYEAFSNLNQRFQSLLTYSPLHLKISLVFNSEEKIQRRYTDIVIPNQHKIIALSLSISSLNTIDFTRCTFDSSFNHLESLELYDIELNQLIPLLPSLFSIPRLGSLTIDCDDDFVDLSNIYEIIFQLLVLKYCKLSFYPYSTSFYLPISTKDQFSDIEHLVIDHPCTLDELVIILSYTTRLCRLSCTDVNGSHEDKECSAGFDELETFVLKKTPHLEQLRLSCFGDMNFLDSDRWERLISEHMTCLSIFEFSYREFIDEWLEVTQYHELINKFNSSFWIKRNWLFRININTDDYCNYVIIYSIFTDRKNSSDLAKYKNNGNYLTDAEQIGLQHDYISNEQACITSTSFDEMNQLIIADYPVIDDDAYDEDDEYDDEDTSITDMISPILIAVQIKCLNITYREIFIGTLVDLIRCLPNLDSLVVFSLSMTKPRYLSADEARNLRVVSNTNKISKVKLHQMTDLAQGQFLLDLCPSIRYFEVDCAHGVTPKTFIRFILMKNVKYIPHLSTLCLETSSTNENVVENSKKMIDMEQLCQNYAIKQIDKKIYFQWK